MSLRNNTSGSNFTLFFGSIDLSSTSICLILGETREAKSQVIIPLKSKDCVLELASKIETFCAAVAEERTNRTNKSIFIDLVLGDGLTLFYCISKDSFTLSLTNDTCIAISIASSLALPSLLEIAQTLKTL